VGTLDRHADRGVGRGDEGVDHWERWKAHEHTTTGNWLVRDDLQRRQLLELNRRLREKAKPAFPFVLALGSAAALRYGWLIILPPVVLGTAYILVEHHIERLRHPEYALGIAWLGLQTSFGLSAVLANGQMIFAAPLMIVLVIGSSAVFPPRGVVVGVAWTAAIMISVGFAVDSELMVDVPAITLFQLALLVGVGMLGAAIGRSTIDYRDLSIIDRLTGLFNRNALQSRAAELAYSSADTGTPVAVIVADIDHFKVVNDGHGHSTGDVVLREIGERIRTNLRAFESAYRIGGEEFVILLDGVDRRRAQQVASRLREAIGEAPIAGVPTTMSFGLAATSAGEVFDYDAVFRCADAALYQAKRTGGNRVVAAPSDRELAQATERVDQAHLLDGARSQLEQPRVAYERREAAGS
jgi:diguanylate cyclase (GGDEF)-like protein